MDLDLDLDLRKVEFLKVWDLKNLVEMLEVKAKGFGFLRLEREEMKVVVVVE